MWKGWMIMGLGLALVGCTRAPDLTQVSDVGLATRMAQACWDFNAAFARGQAQHLSFDANVEAMAGPTRQMLDLVTAMESRTNVQLQYVRRYWLEGMRGDVRKIDQACAIASSYALDPASDPFTSLAQKGW